METDKKRASTNGRFRHTPFGRTLVSNLFGRQQGTKMSAKRKLKGKAPKPEEKRGKALFFGKAGVGKTTAAIQWPMPYVIDCERGTTNYDKIINAKGGVVMHTVSVQEIIDEVRTLITVEHPYQTLVIDPITAAYSELLDDCEKRVGTDFGRHYGAAAKHMKRLVNLFVNLDMNVVITAHAKNEYGDGLKVIGETFDAWRNLDYTLDLAFRITALSATQREAEVTKTRLESFPLHDRFVWSYDAFADRYGRGLLERNAVPIELATDEHVIQFNDMLNKLTEQEINRLGIKKALRGVDNVADLEDVRIVKGIDLIGDYLSQKGSM